MTTFLTTIADDVERCRHSLRYRELITISVAVDGTIRIINGVVNIIEPVRDVEVQLWKISISTGGRFINYDPVRGAPRFPIRAA